MSEHIKDGQIFKLLIPTNFRWLQYHAKSTQWKKGIKGRFQECDEYGNWTNSGWSESTIFELHKGLHL